MSDRSRTERVKEIRVDLDKCVGCRACEVACSGFHARPKFSSYNPERSRIRVVLDLVKDVYVPIRAGDYTQTECHGRNTYTIKGKEYNECSFCNSSCPARDLFREPDSGLPLKCDMCSDDPTQAEPLCVQVCCVGALTYREREVKPAVEGKRKGNEVENALEALVRDYGLERVNEMVGRLSRGKRKG